MMSDPKAKDPKAERLTGSMIVKEFLTQCLAPLQAHSRPLWRFKGGVDDLRLRLDDLSDEELGKVVRTLLGKDQGGPPDTHLPLYHRADREKIANAMPIFNERGLAPLEPSRPPAPRCRCPPASLRRKGQTRRRPGKAW